MKIDVRYLENLKLEALFDDFSVKTDQPIRYKGDGTAPGPFDYFLASSVLCAAYFVKVYCKARDISTDDISVTQNNIVDPENRYKQTFHIQVDVPESISEKDREGILRSIDRCTVKKTIQENPEFLIELKNTLGKDANLFFDQFLKTDKKTSIIGKDSALEDSISKMASILDDLGIKIEISSWRNPVPNVWSVHIRDADSPLCYTNGKGNSKNAALASAMGEYLERISNNYFYNDYYLDKEISSHSFVHYPDEKWFKIPDDNSLPEELLDEYTLEIYQHDNELKATHLYDTNSDHNGRGICALPFIRQSDKETIYFPVNLIGNLFVSNGMSAGNSKYETRVQCLSEIFERAVKNKIITEEITLPDVPRNIIEKFPSIKAGIDDLESKGFPIVIKDASLGGRFPVMNVTLMNPKTGGVFSSFGAHPNFEIALERSLTELLQGRSFEGLNEMPAPTFNEFAIKEHNNIIDHFIDSTGVISWKFFKDTPDYDFNHWNFSGSTEEEFHYLMDLLTKMNKEVYIADYNDLGFPACRILVPGFSEIYLAEDLLWDNSNKALNFREDILNLHSLSNEQLKILLEKFENSELDNHMPISELIGVAFDENSIWGELIIGELKSLILMVLKDYEQAKFELEHIINFNDSSVERRKFFQILNIALDIEINDYNFDHYKNNLINIYSEKLVIDIQKIFSGETKFYGLEPLNGSTESLITHKRLLESYMKLHSKRSKS